MTRSTLPYATLFALAGLAAAADTKPFGGKPAAVPGTVQAEDFDDGPEGVAFHDIDKKGLVTPDAKDSARVEGQKYRKAAPNVEKTKAGVVLVGSVKEGEWLAYTVDVAKTGTYDLEASVAGWGKTRGTFRVEFDGVDVTGPVEVPNTGKWSTFRTVKKPGVPLKKGVQTMRVVVVKGSEVINLDSFTFAEAKP